MVQDFDQQINRSNPIDSSVIDECFICSRGALAAIVQNAAPASILFPMFSLDSIVRSEMDAGAGVVGRSAARAPQLPFEIRSGLDLLNHC